MTTTVIKYFTWDFFKVQFNVVLWLLDVYGTKITTKMIMALLIVSHFMDIVELWCLYTCLHFFVYYVFQCTVRTYCLAIQKDIASALLWNVFWSVRHGFSLLNSLNVLFIKIGTVSIFLRIFLFTKNVRRKMCRQLIQIPLYL